MIQGYEVVKPKKSFRRILFFAVTAVVLLAFAFFVYAYVKINRPASSVSVPVTVTVEKGAGTSRIADVLEENGLVSNARLFVIYSMLNGGNGKMQAGTYDLDRKMTMAEILDTLTGGDVSNGNEVRFTVIEGWTSAQVADRIEQRGLSTAEEFEAALQDDYGLELSAPGRQVRYEGFLFPDTYEFHAEWDDHDRVSVMLRNFESKFTDQMLADMQAQGLDILETVTMASIVEREVGRAPSVTLTGEVLDTMQDEREKVASVFYNRLAIGMALQSDATVNYVTGKSDRQALFSDLEVDSPYNTYKYPGLPPGPISNPGIGSIMAAIYPADTDYLYFLSKIDGETVFASTLEGHGQNRALYLD